MKKENNNAMPYIAIVAIVAVVAVVMLLASSGKSTTTAPAVIPMDMYSGDYGADQDFLDDVDMTAEIDPADVVVETENMVGNAAQCGRGSYTASCYNGCASHYGGMSGTSSYDKERCKCICKAFYIYRTIYMG